MKGELKYKSDALDFGTLYDMLLFEREQAFEKYIVMSDSQVLHHAYLTRLAMP